MEHYSQVDSNLVKADLQKSLSKVSGVINAELVENESGGYIANILAYSKVVDQVGIRPFMDALDKGIHDKYPTLKVDLRVMRVNPVTAEESIKLDMEDEDGVLGVFIAPLEWDENKMVKALQFNIFVDKDKTDKQMLINKFNDSARKHGLRIRAKVHFGLYQSVAASTPRLIIPK
jgi:hypothetical protein